MDLRRELYYTIATLVVLTVLLAFVAIGLFIRMGPAIERILEENIHSIVDAEEMIVVLAQAHGRAVPDEGRHRFEEALRRAKENVTEPGEVPVLDSIQRELQAGFDGDRNAVTAMIHGIQGLITINRDAMKDVDREAQRLGGAGAWTAVFVGFLSFLLGAVVLGRLRRRVLNPVVELHQVLEGARLGNGFRRCRPRDAPREIRQVLEAVNLLLDERLKKVDSQPSKEESVQRAALVELLERQPTGAFVIDRSGAVVCASKSALSELAGSGGHEVKEASLALAGTGEVAGAPFRAIELSGGSGWLCFLNEARGPA